MTGMERLLREALIAMVTRYPRLDNGKCDGCHGYVGECSETCPHEMAAAALEDESCPHSDPVSRPCAPCDAGRLP